LWLRVITAINSEIGSISPPSGLVLFGLETILPRDFTTPQASTWLPSRMAQTARRQVRPSPNSSAKARMCCATRSGCSSCR
jgi:hypothetical protein